MDEKFSFHVSSIFVLGKCCSGGFSSFIHQRIAVSHSGSGLTCDN